MKKVMALFLIFSLILGNAYGAFSSKDVGTTVFPFLKIAVDAGNVGMGEVGGAFVDDASAMYWNVAGIAAVRNLSVVGEFNKWFIDSKQGYFGLVKAMNVGNFGLAVNYLYVGNIQGYNPEGTPTGKYVYNNYAVSLGYARQIGALLVGSSLKYINHSMTKQSFSESGFALDLGVIKPRLGSGNMSAGLTVQNLGPAVNGQSLPLNIRLGVAGVLLKGNKLLWGADLNLPIDNIPNIHLGAQYALNQIVSLRLGFTSNRSKELGTLSYISAGFGLNLGNYKIDVAYSPYQYIASLGGAIRVSAKANF